MSAAKSIIQTNIFNERGYIFKNGIEYELDKSSSATKSLIDKFNYLGIDECPGSRYRAYLKLYWYRSSNVLMIATDQKYYQSCEASVMNNEKIKEFKVLPPEILTNDTLQKIVYKNIEFINQCDEFKHNKLIFGIHFVRHHVVKDKASYDSPVWLRAYEEPIVFIHLIHITENIIGGDNIIAAQEDEIKNVFRFSQFMDTMVFNRKVRHAVTPMGSTGGVALRDIILFTAQPANPTGVCKNAPSG